MLCTIQYFLHLYLLQIHLDIQITKRIATNIFSRFFVGRGGKKNQNTTLTHSSSQVDKDRGEFQANKHYFQTEDKNQFSPQLQSSGLDNHAW